MGRIPVCHVPASKMSNHLHAQKWYEREGIQPIVIHRDGRDVMVSLYFWSKHSGGGGVRSLDNEYTGKNSTVTTIKDEVDKMTFSGWLRSNTFVASSPELDDTPVTYWNKYTLEMIDFEAYHVTYEGLNTGLMDIDNPVLLGLEKELKLERLDGIKILTQHPHPSGPAHGPGIVGRWKEFFDEDDLGYFTREASDAMTIIDERLQW